MGQRTMFYTVAEDRDGNKWLRSYYCHDGSGRLMPLVAMKCIINSFMRSYNWKTHVSRIGIDVPEDVMKNEHFLILGSEAELTPQYFGKLAVDNNNGAMVLFIKESENALQYDNYKIGFLLGPEDEKYEQGLGKAWERWLTLDEWCGMEVNRGGADKKFLTWFHGFMEEFEVEEMANK